MQSIIKSYCKLLVFTFFVFTSCIPVKTLTVDFPVPAEKELPDTIQSLAIVAQYNNEKFSDLPGDSLQKILYKKKFNLDTVIYDLMMADTTIQVLGQLLFESGRYDYIIPENRFIEPEGQPQASSMLSWNQVNSICKIFNTDAVLSLDHIAARVITSYGNKSYYDPYMSGFYSLAAVEMKIGYEAIFRVYDPKGEKILHREFIKDTLIWEDADASLHNLLKRFTPAKTGLIEAGIEIALDLANNISVQWLIQRRKLFIRGNSKMKYAADLAASNNWLTAMTVWKEIEEHTKSRSLKSKALLNTAVAYEMLGDIDQAISWALKSYKTQFRPLTYEYLEILKIRKRESKN